MKEIVYDKLVRDKIPEIIEHSGKRAECSVLSKSEALDALNKKLTEETREYLESGETEEIADILEVLRGIAAMRDISWEKVEQLREQKKAERGGFEERIFLHRVTQE